MFKVVKYVISKTKGKVKFYLCSQLDGGCVNFYSLPYKTYCKWGKDLSSAIKFSSVSLARNYANKFSEISNIKVEPIIYEEIKVKL